MHQLMNIKWLKWKLKILKSSRWHSTKCCFEQTNNQTNKRTNEQMNKWTNKQTNKRRNEGSFLYDGKDIISGSTNPTYLAVYLSVCIFIFLLFYLSVYVFLRLYFSCHNLLLYFIVKPACLLICLSFFVMKN